MGERLEGLKIVRDILEDAYIEVTAKIKQELLSDALVNLTNTPGVMEYLNQQKLQDYIGEVL